MAIKLKSYRAHVITYIHIVIYAILVTVSYSCIGPDGMLHHLHESFHICTYALYMVEKCHFDVRHKRTGHNHALIPSNHGTQWVVVSAGIAQERVVMARSQMPDVDRMLRRPSAAPPTAPVGAP